MKRLNRILKYIEMKENTKQQKYMRIRMNSGRNRNQWIVVNVQPKLQTMIRNEIAMRNHILVQLSIVMY